MYNELAKIMVEEAKKVSTSPDVHPIAQMKADFTLLLSMLGFKDRKEVLDAVLQAFGYQKARYKMSKWKERVAEMVVKDADKRDTFISDYEAYKAGDITQMPKEYGSSGNISKILFSLRAMGVLDENNKRVEA